MKEKGKGRGGARPGSGPKRRSGPFAKRVVLLTDKQVEELKKWGGGDMSVGLRWLIDHAAPLVGPAVVSITPPVSPTPSS